MLSLDSQFYELPKEVRFINLELKELEFKNLQNQLGDSSSQGPLVF